VNEQKTGWLGYYILVGTVWGFSFLFISQANQFLTPYGVSFWRLALGGLPILLLSLVQRRKLPTSLRAWGLLFVVSLFMNSIPSFLFSFAEQHVTSAFAGIMNATTPIATVAMILTVFREEKPSRKVLSGLAVGLIGVLIVLAVWNGFGSNDPLAVLALIGAVTLYGIGGPFARRYLSPLKLDPQVQVSVQVLLACITMVPFYVSGPLFTANPSMLQILELLIFGVLGTGFAYVWYYRLMALAGSAIANSVTYLSPVVAVLVGGLLLHEAITWNQILGGFIVILGAAISQGRLDGLLAKLGKTRR
jgi:drug/metabolite transporter (DMT)-like permease